MAKQTRTDQIKLMAAQGLKYHEDQVRRQCRQRIRELIDILRKQYNIVSFDSSMGVAMELAPNLINMVDREGHEMIGNVFDLMRYSPGDDVVPKGISKESLRAQQELKELVDWLDDSDQAWIQNIEIKFPSKKVTPP